MRYSIRADEKGIVQTNGVFTQSAGWDEVNFYYLELNDRYHGERRFHMEPVMFDAQGKEVFRGFAHLIVSTRRIVEQRRLLRQFVEARLEGKKRKTSASKVIKPSIQRDWSQKSRTWKIGRGLALISYALLWFGILVWFFVDALNNSGKHFWVAKFLLPLFPSYPN